jgi:hypothetical protein
VLRRNKPDAGRLIHTASQALTGADGQGPLPRAQLISIFRVRSLGFEPRPSIASRGAGVPVGCPTGGSSRVLSGHLRTIRNSR